MDRQKTRQSASKLMPLAPSPAEQANICQGIVPLGEQDRVALVTVMLTYSHAVWAEFCVADDDKALPKVLEHAWEFFGGSPRIWLFETMAQLDPRVLELARRYSAIARLFALHDGVHWGELALRSVPPRLLCLSMMCELDLANRALRCFCLERLERDHPRMLDRRVHDLLEEERSYLFSAGSP